MRRLSLPDSARTVPTTEIQPEQWPGGYLAGQVWAYWKK